MAAEQCLGVVEVWRLDHARPSLDGCGRRRRALVQVLKNLGRGPGRWATADGSIPFFETGVYFDSFQSHRAMGFFQLAVLPVVFLDGGGRRRGFRAPSVRRDPVGFVVFFSRVLCDVWWGHLSLYPCCTSLYLYEYLYVLLI
jgi:hypothetical protein